MYRNQSGDLRGRTSRDSESVAPTDTCAHPADVREAVDAAEDIRQLLYWLRSLLWYRYCGISVLDYIIYMEYIVHGSKNQNDSN